MDAKFDRRFQSFCNSLDALAEARERDLTEAFKANLISDDAWMDMLKVRNELAYDYDCEIVKTHCNTIVKEYIDLFYEFKGVVNALEM